MATPINTILTWFQSGDVPTETQFANSWTSFFHKDERIPMASVDGLSSAIQGKMDREVFDSHLINTEAHSTILAKIDGSNLTEEYIQSWKTLLGVSILPDNVGTIDKPGVSGSVFTKQQTIDEFLSKDDFTNEDGTLKETITTIENPSLIGAELTIFYNNEAGVRERGVVDLTPFKNSVINAANAGYKGDLKKTDTAPTIPGMYRLLEFGDYTNLTPAVDAVGNPTVIKSTDGKINQSYFDGSVWMDKSIVLPQSNVDGVVEINNEDAVSGGEVYNRFKNIINLGSLPIPFTLAAGGINMTTGVPNTSVNWLRTLPVPSQSSTGYALTGFGMDSNSVNARVFFYNGNTFLSHLASGSATTFPFTTPSNCDNFMVQVFSGTDVGLSPGASPFNNTLKISKGNLVTSDSLPAEKIEGTIQTPQLKNLDRSYIIDNSEFGDKFEFTNKVSILDYKTIGMSASSGVNHMNFAASKENDISIVEATIKSIASNGSIRLGFGDSNACFQLVKTATSSSLFDVYMMSRYGVTSIGSLQIGSQVSLKADDKLRIFRSGLNINAYINNVFVGNINLLNQGALGGSFKGIVGFRDNVQYWQAESVNLKKRKSQYIHLSIDDSINVFRELAISNPVSIFDNSRLAIYKEMHDKYGACFSLFAFYQNSSGTFNLSQMPVTWKAEFIANSHWLKIGFHGVDDATDYTNIALADGVEHYTRIINEVNRFAGYSSIDNMPRFSKFKGNKPLHTELKKYGLVGVLAADDTRPEDSGLTTTEQTALRSGDDYYNYEIGFYYVRTSPRLDLVNASAVLNMLKTENNSLNTRNVFEMFYHEGRESTLEGKEMIEALCKYAYDNRIRFDFPQNNILN
ncbi:hypothetical protein [Chryseobacterium cucumeris]|uniref:hypothetical protein n=1 Tax=Chryseobacterium cucumeris TaxID=1813611 RepID=UPI001F4A5BA3|nr:hypothetical protein [Chryseobacterium cucumeris]